MGFTIASKTLLLLAAAAVSPSQAAIAAWWNGIAPQIILQNTTTGAIRHSACNVFGTPTYSYTDGSELPLDFPPKNGTPLAGVGYWNEVTTIASVYYVEKGGALANVLLECNMATGLFRNSGNRIISTTGVTVSNNSGLAALLLGATGGYRVYFNDADMAINEIGYTRDNGWEYRGIISRDPQGWGALGAQFTGQDNITVASARDIRTMEAVRYHADGNWRISTLPYSLGGNITTQNSNASSIAINETAPVNFTLAAWTGKPRSLGVAINPEYTRSIWYIGSDRALYSVQNKNFFWSQQTNQSDAFWPLADEPNGELGIASQFSKSMVRIYYFVKGQLAEIKYEGGSWKSWAPVGPNKAVVSNPPTSSGTPGTVAAAAGSSGLSTGAKAGVGVGVALGVIAMCVLGATLFLMRKRKKAAAAGLHPNPLEHPSPVPPYGSPAPGPDAAGYNQYQWEKKDLLPQPPYPFYPTEPAQLDATGKPTELDAPRPTYELPDQTYSHELMGDSNTKPPTQASQPGQQAN